MTDSKCSSCNGSGQDSLGMVCSECMGEGTTEKQKEESAKVQEDADWKALNESQGHIAVEGDGTPLASDERDPWDGEKPDKRTTKTDEVSVEKGNSGKNTGGQDSKDSQARTAPGKVQREDSQGKDEKAKDEKVERSRLAKIEEASKRRAEICSMAATRESKTSTKKKKQSSKIEFGGDGCPLMNTRCEGSLCCFWIRTKGCGVQVAIKTIIYRLRRPKPEEAKNEKEKGKGEKKPSGNGKSTDT